MLRNYQYLHSVEARHLRIEPSPISIGGGFKERSRLTVRNRGLGM